MSTGAPYGPARAPVELTASDDVGYIVWRGYASCLDLS